MPNNKDKDEPSQQGYGRLKDGLDADGNIPQGARIWWDRGYLPHMESQEAVQHVCFRLDDSLPLHVVEEMEAELKSLPPMVRKPEQERRVNAYLDAGHGSCILRDPVIAELVQSTLLHFHRDRYVLHAWCIMPNHVHVLFQTNKGWTMSKIVASWKSFTGRRMNAYRKVPEGDAAGAGPEPGVQEAGLEPGEPSGKERGDRGVKEPVDRVWQRGYFDRFMRDGGHFANTVNYIHMNPVKVRLVGKPEEWMFSSARWSGEDAPSPRP